MPYPWRHDIPGTNLNCQWNGMGYWDVYRWRKVSDGEFHWMERCDGGCGLRGGGSALADGPRKEFHRGGTDSCSWRTEQNKDGGGGCGWTFLTHVTPWCGDADKDWWKLIKLLIGIYRWLYSIFKPFGCYLEVWCWLEQIRPNGADYFANGKTSGFRESYEKARFTEFHGI